MREVVLDTETTGLDPASGDRIVEIGAIELMNRFATKRAPFHEYINPERDMPAEAERVHGLSSAFLADKPVFADIAQKFVDFVGDAVLVIHNAPFDLKFINAELRRVGIPPYPAERCFDTLAFARRKYPGSPASLDALCKRFEIDNTARDKHGALLDASLLYEVYVDLIGARQARLGLDPLSEVPYGAARKRPKAKPRPVPLPRNRITTAEAEAHAAFIDGLGPHALWRGGAGPGALDDD